MVSVRMVPSTSPCSCSGMPLLNRRSIFEVPPVPDATCVVATSCPARTASPDPRSRTQIGASRSNDHGGKIHLRGVGNHRDALMVTVEGSNLAFDHLDVAVGVATRTRRVAGRTPSPLLLALTKTT